MLLRILRRFLQKPEVVSFYQEVNIKSKELMLQEKVIKIMTKYIKNYSQFISIYLSVIRKKLALSLKPYYP